MIVWRGGWRKSVLEFVFINYCIRKSLIGGLDVCMENVQSMEYIFELYKLSLGTKSEYNIYGRQLAQCVAPCEEKEGQLVLLR